MATLVFLTLTLPALKIFSYPHRENSPYELRVLLAQAVFFLTSLSLGGLS